jgi:hypothetical protein
MERAGGSSLGDLQLPIGGFFVTDVSDPEPVESLLHGLEGMLALEGIEFTGTDPVIVTSDGEEIAAFQLGDDSLAVATPAGALSEFTAGGGLTDNELYQELVRSLGNDGLVVFADLSAVFDELPIPADERAILAPMRGIGASMSRSGDLIKSSSLLLIDY